MGVLVFAGDEDDLGALARRQGADEVEARPDGEVDVQENEVGALLGDQAQPVDDVVGDAGDGEVGVANFQHLLEDGNRGGFVLDQ